MNSEAEMSGRSKGGGGGSAPATSIVMVSKNEMPFVKRCLDGVFAQEGAGSFEVICIDSGSTDGTVDIAKQYPLQLLQIPPETFHHARTRNLGAQMARGENVVFMNGHAVPIGDRWLANLLQPLADPRVVATYSRHVARPDAWPWVRWAHEWNYGDEPEVSDLAACETKGLRAFFFSTVSAAVRKSFLERFPFPRDLGAYEDRYLAFTAITQGFATAYCPDSAVEHSHNSGCVQTFRRYFDLGMLDTMIGIHGHGNGKVRIGSQGMGHIRRELSRLQGGQWATTLPPMLLHDAAKFAGYCLGMRFRRLPKAWVNRITLFQRSH